MSLHRIYLTQASQMLLNLRAWLEKAQDHANASKFDANVLLSARLFPDQFPLVQQVQVACDSAKLTAARLTRKEPPKHPDTEQTISELLTRIDSTRDLLATLDERAFEGAETRVIVLPFNPSRASLGEDYVHEFALPNLYFHVTTAYAILRHNGVPLGKQDFIGRLTTQPAP